MSMLLKRFADACRGAVLPTFALTAIPLVVAMGAVVDYTNAWDQQTIVQDAMDSAALAAGKKIGLLTMEQLQQDVNNYFTANIGEQIYNPPTLNTAVNVSTITLTTELHVPTYFLGIIGIDELIFDLQSQATLALGTLEVMLVLDNSGSMNTDNNIATLRQAATKLTNTLYGLGATSTKPDPVKVGLVPFAAAVNVGPGSANQPWIDSGAIGPYHADSMDGNANTVNAMTLWSGMNNTSWGGCVEMRPMPYDVLDTAPTAALPATLFVPMFAPDEPDNWTSTSSCSSSQKTGSGTSLRYNCALSGAQNYNNYLPDFGGTCSGTNANWTCANGSCGAGANETTAYARTCKYGTPGAKVTPANITVGGIPGGPNFMCTTTSMMPLTTNQGNVTTSISNMIAQGATNLQAGLMWGWHALSPTAPLTEGRDYTSNDNQKILILMTDGFNTYYPNSNLLKSWYGAWGFVSKNHLGSTSTNQGVLIGKMNERTTLACTNVKEAGITVYTVSFQVSDADTLEMMRNCATDPSMAYISTSQSALLAAFAAIGDEITLLRISK